VRIPYVGGEELDEAPTGILVAREQPWEHSGPGRNRNNVLGHPRSPSSVSA
jgi:hypothetical protein